MKNKNNAQVLEYYEKVFGYPPDVMKCMTYESDHHHYTMLVQCVTFLLYILIVVQVHTLIST